MFLISCKFKMKTVVLLDLDGTLISTSDSSFKKMKDGLEDVDFRKIKSIEGAEDFVKKLKANGCLIFIISDSHPRYVNKVVDAFFGVPCLSLADKPNIFKSMDFLKDFGISYDKKPINYFVVGDTWLDIALGRGLGALTILVDFDRSKGVEERDGIGQPKKHWKCGPTFYVKSYNTILSILNDKTAHLFSGEAVFQNRKNPAPIRFETKKTSDRFIIFRALARQQQGECDSFARADKYFEFGRVGRGIDTLEKLAASVDIYLDFVMSFDYKWDCLTYVPDKSTTQPPNKMKDFFDQINVDVKKYELFEWVSDVSGSTRKKPNFESRSEFVEKNLNCQDNIELQGKNIIILDDQITTGATAQVICQKLIEKGVGNIMFLALFALIDNIESQRACPRCGKKLQVKVNRDNGSKFFSCVPPRYKGTGCGFLEDIL